jgi:hypothetical protein
MGSLFGSKTTAVSDPTAVEAFNLAKPYYQQGLSGLSGLAKQVGQNPAYTGERVADLNPFQTSAADSLGGFSGNTAGYANTFMNAGLGNLGAASGIGANAQDIYGRSTMDPTQMIIQQAGQYADNPYVTGMIDAANRDTVRALTEQQLPSLMRGMTGTGNLNSSAGMKEGQILTRGAQDRMADMASNIRGQFFGTGLNMAQNQYNQNLQNMMSANQNLLQAGQFGGQALSGGQDFAQTAFGQGQLAGGLYQGQNQAELDANRAFFDESIQNPLSVYSALVGNAAQTKTQGTAGVATQPSLASQLGSLALGAVGAYRAFK